ncbi:hypothetical protein [Rhizobium laguerreae]|uniref:hypothetical protein n=1 Tax=Rhizobium laguerreae TaxID=1076926 RepID=UPI001C91FCD4|nr:hypothetical protein [Rhizobium laguerreae]MBY3187917.1 hypothetical protein [Rhizobium laguerreae]
MALRTLADSPIFKPLVQVGKSLDVDVILFGSVASRALLFDAAGAPAKSLFELVEHVSDIDIAHTGPPSITSEFARAVATEMPLAPWFRWSIVDREQLSELDSLERYNVTVPMRQFKIGTQRLFDPVEKDEIFGRALQGDIDLLPNPRFGESPRSSFDSEATAVLLYVDAALDVLQVYFRREPPGHRLGPGKASPAKELIATGVRRLEDMTEPQRSIALRRLWCRFAGSAVRVSPTVWQRAVDFFGLGPLVELLEMSGFSASQFVEGHGIRIVSDFLGSGMYRMPKVIFDADAGLDWEEALKSALEGTSDLSSVDRFLDPIVLAPGNEVIGGLLDIPVTKGASASSPHLGSSKQEFFYISLPLPKKRPPIDSASLTAVVVGHEPEGSSILPAFASVSTAMGWPFDRGTDEAFDGGRCTIRISVPGMQSNIRTVDVFLITGGIQ